MKVKSRFLFLIRYPSLFPRCAFSSTVYDLTWNTTGAKLAFPLPTPPPPTGLTRYVHVELYFFRWSTSSVSSPTLCLASPARCWGPTTGSSLRLPGPRVPGLFPLDPVWYPSVLGRHCTFPVATVSHRTFPCASSLATQSSLTVVLPLVTVPAHRSPLTLSAPWPSASTTLRQLSRVEDETPVNILGATRSPGPRVPLPSPGGRHVYYKRLPDRGRGRGKVSICDRWQRRMESIVIMWGPFTPGGIGAEYRCRHRRRFWRARRRLPPLTRKSEEGPPPKWAEATGGEPGQRALPARR